MDRNLALEFVRVTEAAALAAGRWIGRGDKNAADQAAVTAMRGAFNSIEFVGEVVIGEGDRVERGIGCRLHHSGRRQRAIGCRAVHLQIDECCRRRGRICHER